MELQNNGKLVRVIFAVLLRDVLNVTGSKYGCGVVASDKRYNRKPASRVNAKLKCPLFSQVEMSLEQGMRKLGGQFFLERLFGKRSASGRRLQAGERWGN